MAKPTSDEIKNNIQAEDAEVWNQADQRPQALGVFEDDLAKAIAAAWAKIEDAFVIASVPVSGGTSAPGGPLQNGAATLSPGMLVNTASFAAIADDFSTSFPDGATDGLLALVKAIAQGLAQKFALWVAGYSAALIASGGACVWIPGPIPPPAPGPWSGGKIDDFALANGASAGDPGMTAASLDAAIVMMADPAKLKQNRNQLQPALQALITAMAKGFEKTWNDWKKNTKISGGSGAGVASPPAGSVVGVVASPKIG